MVQRMGSTSDGTLADFVETLLKLLKVAPEAGKRLHDQADRIELLRSLLTEFDDPWVEIVIRREYTKLRKRDDKATRLLIEAYVEDRQCFASAFKTDEDFQAACRKYAPELNKQEPNSVRIAFGAAKYILQKNLGELLDRTVLIGSTDKKLSYGIRSDGTAKFLGVSDLHDFLIRKKVHSLTFNFWYEKRGAEHDEEREREAIIAEALPHLEKVVTKQLLLKYT